MTTSPDTSATLSDGPVPSARGLVARALVRGVSLYQQALGGRPTACRFYPSCSAYAVEALQAHGAAKGSWLAVRRLAKCHPFGPHGIDLVPPTGGHS